MAVRKVKANNDKPVFDQGSFIRDGRAPIPKSAVTSKVMSANRAKDTKPEVMFRKALWAAGVKGYRLHWKNVPGRPDIAFPSQKVAIFINGCFWHRCPKCKLPIPKSNSFFWKDKFNKNVERDKRKIKLLNEANWKTLVIWECELKTKLEKSIGKVKDLLARVD